MAPTDDTPKSSPARWIVAGMIVVGAGVGLFIAMGDARRSASDARSDEVGTSAPMQAEAATSALPGDSIQRIGDRGRLSVDLESLRDGDVMALALDLPDDEAMGDGVLQAKVIDVAGRRYDTETLPIEGAAGGLRLEIDPDWLRPGQYMIEIKTAEKKPLALRRYVLEVTSDGYVSE